MTKRTRKKDVRKGRTQLPHVIGLNRLAAKTKLHEEVELNIRNIAEENETTRSYVLAEIVYAFFGLQITKTNKVRIRRKYRVGKTNVVPFVAKAS